MRSHFKYRVLLQYLASLLHALLGIWNRHIPVHPQSSEWTQRTEWRLHLCDCSLCSIDSVDDFFSFNWEIVITSPVCKGGLITPAVESNHRIALSTFCYYIKRSRIVSIKVHIPPEMVFPIRHDLWNELADQVRVDLWLRKVKNLGKGLFDFIPAQIRHSNLLFWL